MVDARSDPPYSPDRSLISLLRSLESEPEEGGTREERLGKRTGWRVSCFLLRCQIFRVMRKARRIAGAVRRISRHVSFCVILVGYSPFTSARSRFVGSRRNLASPRFTKSRNRTRPAPRRETWRVPCSWFLPIPARARNRQRFPRLPECATCRSGRWRCGW
uniref:Uncharacterized protein n=1 Tax=Candidatus Kentrum sp. LPFa TaxID=2126335 RepID=A0A450W1B3_9GAMM|nr:MAG: hypothetical protein BECKLPF1236B_GA0070989_101610 [Candidatus Kentron sp. LPFa]